MTITSPRWLVALKHAANLPENQRQNVYQLATIDAQFMPHVRTVVHRDILHPATSPHLPIILTTTDVRTPKIAQLRAHAEAELCWWMQGSQDQFRLSGTVRIVSAHTHDDKSAGADGDTLAFDKMREQGFDWEQKRLAVFDGMSAHMKASWCRPPPGSIMDSYEDAKKWPTTVPKLGEAESDEEKGNQEQALANFALVLMEVMEVDWAQLGVKPNQRTRFTRSGEEWLEQIIVP